MPRYLGLRSNWNQKPPRPARVDLNHPLARGLVSAWVLNEAGGGLLRDCIGPNDMLPSVYDPAAIWTGGIHGPALQFPGTVSGEWTGSVRGIPFPNVMQAFSLWWKVDANPGAQQTIFTIDNAGTASAQVAFNYDGLGTLAVMKSGSIVLVQASALPAVGVYHHAAYSFRPDGNLHSLWIDGTLQNTTSTTPDSAAPTTCRIGGRGTAGQNLAGSVSAVSVFNTALHDGDVLRLCERPFEMFL